MAKDLQTQILKQDALENASSQPIFLTQIEVNGADNFSKDFFAKLFFPLVENSDYTLQQLLEKVDLAYDNLQKTRVFKDVQPSLHVDYFRRLPDKTSFNKDKPIMTRVVYDVEPNEISEGDVALAFNTEDNLELKLGYANNNFNHNAESAEFRVRYRPYKPSEHLASGVRVESNLRNPAFKFVLDLQNLHSNNQVWQQNSVKATTGSIGVEYLSSDNRLLMFHGLALAKRTIYDVQDGAPDALKVFAGDFLKSSVVSRLRYQNVTRLGTFPTEGLEASFRNEISSDQEQQAYSLSLFLRANGTLNMYKSFFNNTITAHIFKEGGSIIGAEPVHLSDRFYLGGFESFRGFARHSVNEHGGLQYYKVGASLFTKLPKFGPRVKDENSPLRLYATGMIGNVGANILQEKGVVSTGLGLRYFNKWVNLDAGYYKSQRLGSDSTYGVRDGFLMEISLGGVSRTH